MSGMYAQYHGPEGLKSISQHIYRFACTLNYHLKNMGYKQLNSMFFDTLKIELPETVSQDSIRQLTNEAEMNFYYPDEKSVNISIDEITTFDEINTIIGIFANAAGKKPFRARGHCNCKTISDKLLRKSAFLKGGTFNRYHSETAMMRYIKMLERKDKFPGKHSSE